MKFKSVFFAFLVCLASSLWAVDAVFAASADGSVTQLSWQTGDGPAADKGHGAEAIDTDQPIEVEDFAHTLAILPSQSFAAAERAAYGRAGPRDPTLPAPLRPPSVG